MQIDLITLFPGIFDSFLKESLIGKAIEKGVFKVSVIDIRNFTSDRHNTADDRPFGGGPGMVLKPEPVAAAIRFAKARDADSGRRKVIMMTPSGHRMTQKKVEELAALDHLILVCGRYEGIDYRINQTLVDEELSIGDYILSGGEVPAMVLAEAVTRLLPGVLGKMESTEEETFQEGLLEYPHYTRPRVFEGIAVPDILLSGDHAAIRKWRMEASLRRTLEQRPDLVSEGNLSPELQGVLEKIEAGTDEKKIEKILDFPCVED